MKTTDKLDEIIRLHLLERAKDIDDEAASLEMDHILSLGGHVEMSAERRADMLASLQQIASSVSFGSLLRSEMEVMQETPSSLAQKSMLPEAVIHQLLMDNIHTNNVPVVLMKNLLKQLRISFDKAEQALRNTFLRLKMNWDEQAGRHDSSVAPAFRKGGFLSKASTDGFPKGNGKNLFENKEVMEKYLKRLKELTAE